MAQVDTSSFEKIYDLTYYGNTTKMNNLLNQQDETTLASWQQNGTNRCEYNSENRIGAFAGFNIPSGMIISHIHLYVTRFSGQNKTLIVTVQYKDDNGVWHDVQDIEVTTTIPYPSNVETVNIGQRAYGIRWIHYKEPVKSSSNNIFFNGMTLYEPDAPSYTVNFNANGGTGTMSGQMIFVDQATALSANTFTRSGHDFVGWGTSSTSGVVYADQEVVTNLASADESITLYAMWDISLLKITLYQNESEKNKIGKELTQVLQVSGRLREETSIIDPVILIQCSLPQVALVNYMYIPAFERYYFVTNITSVRTDLVQFEAHCEVLESFKEYILDNEAIIKRQTSLYNIYQDDKRMVFKDPPIVQFKAFPDGFEGFSYVLYVAGGGESDVSYVWVIETTHNTAMDAFTLEGSDGGTGGKYLREGYPGTMPDHFVTIGSYLFRSNWDRIGAWMLMRVDLDYSSTYLGGDDIEHRIIIPESDNIQVWRNGGGADDVNQTSLKVYANSTSGQPQSLTAYDMYSHTSDATAQTISLPNDFKYLRFEWSQHV